MEVENVGGRSKKVTKLDCPRLRYHQHVTTINTLTSQTEPTAAQMTKATMVCLGYHK